MYDRDAVARELQERLGVRVVAKAPPTQDSASAGMVETAIRHMKEKGANTGDCRA